MGALASVAFVYFLSGFLGTLISPRLTQGDQRGLRAPHLGDGLDWRSHLMKHGSTSNVHLAHDLAIAPWSKAETSLTRLKLFALAMLAIVVLCTPEACMQPGAFDLCDSALTGRAPGHAHEPLGRRLSVCPLHDPWWL